MLGLTGAFREAGWRQHCFCLPSPELEAMWEQGVFLLLSCLSLQPTLTEVGNHDTKYQLSTWSNWGTPV